MFSLSFRVYPGGSLVCWFSNDWLLMTKPTPVSGKPDGRERANHPLDLYP